MDAMIRTDVETFHGGLKIARMTHEVLPAVVALEVGCGLNSRGMESYRNLLQNRSAILLVVFKDDVGEDKGVIGAFSGNVVLDELQIDNLAVKEPWRRKGIGQNLLRSALSLASRLGADTAILEVRSANLPARAFYEKEGFTAVGFRKRYYAAPPDDAVLLSREI